MIQSNKLIGLIKTTYINLMNAKRIIQFNLDAGRPLFYIHIHITYSYLFIILIFIKKKKAHYIVNLMTYCKKHIANK
jgi:hypothetical protein